MHQRTCIDFGLNVCIVFCYSQLSPLALTFGNILVQIYARLCISVQPAQVSLAEF